MAIAVTGDVIILGRIEVLLHQQRLETQSVATQRFISRCTHQIITMNHVYDSITQCPEFVKQVRALFRACFHQDQMPSRRISEKPDVAGVCPFVVDVAVFQKLLIRWTSKLPGRVLGTIRCQRRFLRRIQAEILSTRNWSIEVAHSELPKP
jgi:hypothetical protein